MAERYAITESEWKVMEAVWRQPGCMMAEIAASLADSGWQYSTIRTLTNRLVEKGCLTARREGKYYRYTAAAEESACRIAETETLLQRVFGGSVTALVSSLAASPAVTRAEREQLEQLIRRMEEEDARTEK